MIVGVIDIVKALTTSIKSAFSDIKLENSDINKASRPSIYVDIGKISPNDICDLRGENVELQIFYFGTKRDDGRLELLTKQAEFDTLLREPIKVSANFWVYADEVHYEIIAEDMALVCYLSIDTLQQREQVNVDDDMGILIWRIDDKKERN